MPLSSFLGCVWHGNSDSSISPCSQLWQDILGPNEAECWRSQTGAAIHNSCYTVELHSSISPSNIALQTASRLKGQTCTAWGGLPGSPAGTALLMRSRTNFCPISSSSRRLAPRGFGAAIFKSGCSSLLADSHINRGYCTHVPGRKGQWQGTHNLVESE